MSLGALNIENRLRDKNAVVPRMVGPVSDLPS